MRATGGSLWLLRILPAEEGTWVRQRAETFIDAWDYRWELDPLTETSEADLRGRPGDIPQSPWQQTLL